MINNLFFGRKNYLEILEKRVQGLLDGYRQNLAIIGDELVGKTSIIFKFLSLFRNCRVITMYMEVRPEPLQSFAKRFIGVLLYNFLLNSEIELKEDLDFLIDRSTKYIPKTTEKIKWILNSISKRKKNHIFSELFSLSELIYAETGKSCVVILDEFHNIENAGFNNVYREWSKLLITQKNTMYIIVSSLQFKAKAILSHNLSLLFGNFEVITVEAFDIKTSEEYLESRLKGQNVSKGYKDFIKNFTGGYPLYLEVIADSLKSCVDSDLADILEILLFDSRGILNQRFSNYIKRFFDYSHSNEFISILYLISSGRNKIKDIAHILKTQKKDLMPRVNRLLESDTITRSGDFLTINDRVFNFWIRFVYQEKLQSLTFDSRYQKSKFRDKIEAMIQEFLISAGKPLIERTGDLLRLFENEILQIEKKKIRLNHFREIKQLEFNGRSLKEGLIGRSTDSLWIIAFKNELLTDEDITEFVKECKKYRHKLQRKIIVTLKDVDANTRLRALEEKIWTWDINSLNKMMDLFSRPRVIA